MQPISQRQPQGEGKARRTELKNYRKMGRSSRNRHPFCATCHQTPLSPLLRAPKAPNRPLGANNAKAPYPLAAGWFWPTGNPSRDRREGKIKGLSPPGAPPPAPTPTPSLGVDANRLPHSSQISALIRALPHASLSPSSSPVPSSPLKLGIDAGALGPSAPGPAPSLGLP